MVAINYAKDIRVGEQPAKAAALGANFVWPPLPERLFFRGQSLAYDFVRQRYGTRLPGHVTIVAGESPIGSGYLSEAFAARQGAPDLATGSISAQPLPGIEIEAVLFGATSSASQLTIYFLGDFASSLDGIRVWVGGVELAGTPDFVDYYPQENVTTVAYNNPDMDPWVDGGQYTIAITLDGSEPPSTIDYTTNVNDLGIVTRASTATYWGPEGSLLEAAVDEARIQHDPVTGEALGLLAESSATNIFPHSKGDGSFASTPLFTANATTSPTGNMDATIINEVTAGASRYELFIPAGTFSDQTELTFRWMQKILSDHPDVGWVGSRAALRFQSLVNMTAESLHGSVIANLNDGWELREVKVTIVDGLLESRFRAYMGVAGQDAEGNPIPDPFAFYGLQLEQGSNATSYIPTIDSPVTRAADNAVIDLGDEWNPASGTIVVEATVYETVNGQYGAVFLGGDSAGQTFGTNAFGFYVDSRSMNFGFQARRLAGDYFNLPGFVLGQPFKMAMSWSVGDNLVIAAQGVSATRTEVTSGQDRVEMVLLSRAGKFSNGVVKQLLYFPRALSAAELEALTAL